SAPSSRRCAWPGGTCSPPTSARTESRRNACESGALAELPEAVFPAFVDRASIGRAIVHPAQIILQSRIARQAAARLSELEHERHLDVRGGEARADEETALLQCTFYIGELLHDLGVDGARQLVGSAAQQPQVQLEQH